MTTDASTKPPEDDWESVKSDGTIKRYPIPGGWIYGVWEWRKELDLKEEIWIDGGWFLVSSFFVPTTSR